MVEFCADRHVERGYVLTREMADFAVLEVQSPGVLTRLLKIPAPLACYWLGRSELEPARRAIAGP
jgi:hypothetical protein